MAEEFTNPDFVNNSDPETIQARMMNNLPADISDMPGDFPYDFTMPSAIEISQLIQFHIVRTLMLMFPMYAWGEWLDLHGVSAKVTRKLATRASGYVTVEAKEGTIIPEGFVFCTEGTSDVEPIEFAATEEVEVGKSGSADIPVSAVLAGSAYNVTRGVVVMQQEVNQNITSITNEEPIIGGADEEDDETYRERILEKLRSAEVSFVGCDADYVRWAKEVQGVGSAVVEPEWNGPGTVKVVVSGPAGSAVSEDVLQAVEDYIVSPDDRSKRLCPIGAEVTIATVTESTIAYSAIIEVKDGYTIDSIKESYAEALKEYYTSAKDDEEIRYTVVAALLSNTPGVIDFVDFKLAGGVKNIEVEVDDYPVTDVEDMNFTATLEG